MLNGKQNKNTIKKITNTKKGKNINSKQLNWAHAFKQNPIRKSQKNKKPIQTHVKGETNHTKNKFKKL